MGAAIDVSQLFDGFYTRDLLFALPDPKIRCDDSSLCNAVPAFSIFMLDCSQISYSQMITVKKFECKFEHTLHIGTRLDVVKPKNITDIQFKTHIKWAIV